MLVVALANLPHHEALYAAAPLVNLIIQALPFVIALEVVLRQLPGQQKLNPILQTRVEETHAFRR